MLKRVRRGLAQVRPQVSRAAQVWAPSLARLRRLRELRATVRGDGPLFVGPWLGEVGFEVLYWVPFLRWVRDRFGVDPRRVTVISRGGSRAWYDDVAARYVDVFDFFTPAEFKASQERRVRSPAAMGKQWGVGEFDREIFRRARLDVGSGTLLHPSMMYFIFQPFWWGMKPARLVLDHACYGAFPPAHAAALPGLPPSFVAAKFYHSACFPPTDANRQFVRQCLTHLAAKTPVVHLGTGLDIDDHSDSLVEGIPGLVDTRDLVTASNNLSLQTAIISRADGFVGTYGGFSYLAPFYGCRAMVFYSDRNFRQCHLDLAALVCTGAGPRSFVAADVAEVDAVDISSALLGGGA